MRIVPHPSASFVAIDTGTSEVRTRLHDEGFAVRRGETFPGLGPSWIRVAVRDEDTSDRFVTALERVLHR